MDRRYFYNYKKVDNSWAQEDNRFKHYKYLDMVIFSSETKLEKATDAFDIATDALIFQEKE